MAVSHPTRSMETARVGSDVAMHARHLEDHIPYLGYPLLTSWRDGVVSHQRTVLASRLTAKSMRIKEGGVMIVRRVLSPSASCKDVSTSQTGIPGSGRHIRPTPRSEGRRIHSSIHAQDLNQRGRPDRKKVMLESKSLSVGCAVPPWKS
nr:hypothetical protein CFP56_66846 [Quercus suber]